MQKNEFHLASSSPANPTLPTTQAKMPRLGDIRVCFLALLQGLGLFAKQLAQLPTAQEAPCEDTCSQPGQPPPAFACITLGALPQERAGPA